MSDAKVIKAKFGDHCGHDLPGILRDLADAAERGEVTAYVGAYIQNGEYMTLHSASLQNGLVLSDLLHMRALDKFRAT